LSRRNPQGWYLPELFQIVQAGDNANGLASGLNFELARIEPDAGQAEQFAETETSQEVAKSVFDLCSVPLTQYGVLARKNLG
jgi:hypothetical protein